MLLGAVSFHQQRWGPARAGFYSAENEGATHALGAAGLDPESFRPKLAVVRPPYRQCNPIAGYKCPERDAKFWGRSRSRTWVYFTLGPQGGDRSSQFGDGRINSVQNFQQILPAVLLPELSRLFAFSSLNIVQKLEG